jgi:hypothetical protein
MFLIERFAHTPATMHKQTGTVVDGLPVWNSEPVSVMEMQNATLGTDEAGQVVFGHVFLVPPLPVDPVLPLRLTVGGETYDVTHVKYYRNLAGKRLGYRFVVAGG